MGKSMIECFQKALGIWLVVSLGHMHGCEMNIVIMEFSF